MKEKSINVVIVIGKCSRNKKVYGMRFEECGKNLWMGTWAFSIKESAAHKENYDNNSITGSIQFDKTYPGCPFCKSGNIFQCGRCNKTACYDGRSERVTCPWCGSTLTMQGYIEHLDSSMDR